MKTFFDYTTAAISTIALLPIGLIIALLIKIDSKGPVFFRQTRIGKGGKEFKIFKFRTMVTDAEKKGLQLTIGSKDGRITKVGFYLRKSKLDELPQLLNILKGEMSFVGPRPEVPKYVSMYNEEQRKILEVKPGITDFASIEYVDENEMLKNAQDPEKLYIEHIMGDKIRLNMKYINNKNLFLDFKILFLTIIKLLGVRNR